MNTLKLVIGNKNYSSWSLRPWFLLKNLGIEFDEELVYLYEDDTAEKLSPYFSNEQVPILIETSVDTNEQTLQVWDTLAIIETITDKYPDLHGWPQNSNARALARTVSAEMHSSFMALRNALPMNCRKHFPNHPIGLDVQQDIDRIVTLWEYCVNKHGNDGPWLFGQFSGADAMFAPIVLRFIGYDVKLSGISADYVKMVSNNKYMQEWVEAGKKETHIIESDEI